MKRKLKPKSMVGRVPVKLDPEIDNVKAKAKTGSGNPVTIMRSAYTSEITWRQTITAAQGHGRVVVAIDADGHVVEDFEAYDRGVRHPPQERQYMPSLSRSPFAEVVQSHGEEGGAQEIASSAVHEPADLYL
jgi:hypothetical protein